MKIKYYIVTFNNDRVLNNCLSSIYNSYIPDDVSLEINIINNFSVLDESAIIKNDKFRINILNNVLRSDNSNGHLSRNWNQAIILGFQDLDIPNCDLVIAMQNDTIVNHNHINETQELISKYDYICSGAGDQFMVFTPHHIKRVGLFDERFNYIGWQENDYFVRSILYNKQRCTINDHYHYRLHNPVENISLVNKAYFHDNGLLHSMRWHALNEAFFMKKWGSHYNDILLSCSDPLIDSYILYPYFERKIDRESLIKQKYFINGIDIAR